MNNYMVKNMKTSIGILLCLTPTMLFANNIEKETAILGSIYDNVILKDAKETKQSCDIFLNDLSKKQSQARYQEDFKNIVFGWKKVEANYVASAMDDSMIDIPFYLDTFHLGNENVSKSILRILNSDQSPQIGLFKNSYNSFTALETILYTEGNWTDRREAFAKKIVSSICSNINDIYDFYAKNKSQFIENADKSIGMMINKLANQSFKLKDWRLGDPAGLTLKYKNKPDESRSEYPLSKLSLAVNLEIIKAQQALIGKQSYDNFATLLKLRGINEATDVVNMQLEKVAKEMKNLTAFDPDKIKPIMSELQGLHLSYYTTILSQLPVEGKILEADGD